MIQEARLLPGPLEEETPSQIRLPPISFLSGAPNDLSSMKSKEFPLERPASQGKQVLGAPKTKLQHDQMFDEFETRSVPQIPNVGQLSNSQTPANQPYPNQSQRNGAPTVQNIPHNYHTPSPSHQFPASHSYGFQQHLQAPLEAGQRHKVWHTEPVEFSQATSQRPPSTSYHHHHHTHEQEHRHHHHRHHHKQPHHQKHLPNRRISQSMAPSIFDTGTPSDNAPDSSSSGKESKRAKAESSGAGVSKRLKKIMFGFNLKRKHLGTIIYNPTTTWDNLQVSQLHGLDDEERSRLLQLQESSRARAKEHGMKQCYLPVLPCFSNAQINNLVEVKILYKFVKEFQLQLEARPYADAMPVWGGHGGVFSDDSDILGALKLSGLFSETLDLTEWNPSWNSTQVIKPSLVHRDEEGFELLKLSVTLLLLPGLENYHGLYQNGVYSRSWVRHSPHNGLSFALYDVNWEPLGQFGKEISKTLKKSNQQEEEELHRLRSQGTGWVFKRPEKGSNSVQ